MNKRRFPPRLFLLPTALIYLSGTAFAQESAYADLDACVQGEPISMAAKGAGVGALTGLAAGLFSKKKENAVKGAAIGAVVGGVRPDLRPHATRQTRPVVTRIRPGFPNPKS